MRGLGDAKNQGLQTHIGRSIIRNRPIQLYVPFDTIRDYITATDAAARLIMILRQDACPVLYEMRLVAPEHPTTIAEIAATFKRVPQRKLRVVTSVSRNTALYTRRVQFLSLTPPGPHSFPSTSLIVGIGQ